MEQLRRRRIQFRLRTLLALVALVALGFKVPDWWCQAVRYATRKPVLDALERRITIRAPKAEGIDGALRRINAATVSGALPNGLPIFIDNESLGEVGLSGLKLEDPMAADLDVNGVPAKDVLAGLLAPRGLTYVLSEPSAYVEIVNEGFTDLIVDSHTCYVERYLIAKEPTPAGN